MSKEEELAVLWLNLLKMQAMYSAAKGDDGSEQMIAHIDILFSMIEELDVHRTQELLKEHIPEAE